MNGYLSQEALEAYAKLVAEAQGMDFSEGETYDFTRCVRPNGTSYGTGGKCRKGTEEAKAEKTSSARSSGLKKGSWQSDKEAFLNLKGKKDSKSIKEAFRLQRSLEREFARLKERALRDNDVKAGSEATRLAEGLNFSEG